MSRAGHTGVMTTPADHPTDDEGQDDLRAKYRAALERKNHADRDTGAATSGGSGGKAHGPHAAAGGKREFRRKSG